MYVYTADRAQEALNWKQRGWNPDFPEVYEGSRDAPLGFEVIYTDFYNGSLIRLFSTYLGGHNWVENDVFTQFYSDSADAFRATNFTIAPAFKTFDNIPPSAGVK